MSDISRRQALAIKGLASADAVQAIGRTQRELLYGDEDGCYSIDEAEASSDGEWRAICLYGADSWDDELRWLTAAIICGLYPREDKFLVLAPDTAQGLLDSFREEGIGCTTDSEELYRSGLARKSRRHILLAPSVAFPPRLGVSDGLLLGKMLWFSVKSLVPGIVPMPDDVDVVSPEHLNPAWEALRTRLHQMAYGKLTLPPLPEHLPFTGKEDFPTLSGIIPLALKDLRYEPLVRSVLACLNVSEAWQAHFERCGARPMSFWYARKAQGGQFHFPRLLLESGLDWGLEKEIALAVHDGRITAFTPGLGPLGASAEKVPEEVPLRCPSMAAPRASTEIAPCKQATGTYRLMISNPTLSLSVIPFSGPICGNPERSATVPPPPDLGKAGVEPDSQNWFALFVPDTVRSPADLAVIATLSGFLPECGKLLLLEDDWAGKTDEERDGLLTSLASYGIIPFSDASGAFVQVPDVLSNFYEIRTFLTAKLAKPGYSLVKGAPVPSELAEKMKDSLGARYIADAAERVNKLAVDGLPGHVISDPTATKILSLGALDTRPFPPSEVLSTEPCRAAVYPALSRLFTRESWMDTIDDAEGILAAWSEQLNEHGMTFSLRRGALGSLSSSEVGTLARRLGMDSVIAAFLSGVPLDDILGS